MPGLSFAAAGWLAALAAVALPIALHVISRGPARRIQVGSIALLRAAGSRRARRLRPTELWLLLLRCLLLAALALALAAPWLPARGEAAGIVLVAPELLAARGAGQPDDDDFHRRLDAALARDADAVHLLAPGLPRWRGDSPLLDEQQSTPTDLWSLVAEAVAGSPGGRFEVFTVDRQRDLMGARPALDAEIAWHAQAASGSVAWIDEVVRTPDEVQVAIGTSTKASVDRVRLTLPASGPPPEQRREAAFGVMRQGDRVVLRDEDGTVLDERPWPPEPRHVQVALQVAEGRALDAGYVEAALEAAAEERYVSLEITRPQGDSPHDARGDAPDLLVWLDDRPLPADWRRAVETGSLAIRDAPSPYRPCPGVVTLADGRTVQRMRCAAESGGGPDGDRVTTPLWRDGYGGVVLRGEPIGAGRLLHFDGRFDPAWSDLVSTPALVEWVATWIEDSIADEGQRAPRVDDRRRASVAQLAAHSRSEGAVPGRRDLSTIAWWLAAVCFACERGIAGRTS